MKNSIILTIIVLFSLSVSFSCMKEKGWEEPLPGQIVETVSPQIIDPGANLVSFMNTYQTAVGGNLHDAVMDDQGNIAGIGFVNLPETNGYAGYFLKIDGNGTTIYDRPAAEYGLFSPFSIILSSDKNYVIAGTVKKSQNDKNDIIVIKTDKNFQLIWKKEFGTEGEEGCNQLIETKDKGFIIVGNIIPPGSDKDDFYLVKLDSEGNVRWEYTYGTDNYDVGRGVVETKDGGYLAVGYGGNKDIFLLKLNARGKQQWFRSVGASLDDRGNAIVDAGNGEYLVTGMTQIPSTVALSLLKVTETGKVLWDKAFALDKRLYALGQQIKPAGEGRFLIAGATSHENEYGSDALAMMVDGDGKKIWLNVIGNADGEYGNTVIPTLRGDFFIGGYSSKKVDQDENGMKRTVYTGLVPFIAKIK